MEAPTKCVIRYPLTDIFAERQRVSKNGLRTLQRSKDTTILVVILGGTVKDMRLLPRLVGRAFFYFTGVPDEANFVGVDIRRIKCYTNK